jgi:hypothetical protein
MNRALDAVRPGPSIHREPLSSGLRLFTFVHLVTVGAKGLFPPNTLEAQFDLPILGSST